MDVPAQEPVPSPFIKMDSSPSQRRPAESVENQRSLDCVKAMLCIYLLENMQKLPAG